MTLAIITGLAAEAEVLRAAGIAADIRCGGSSPERALLAARAAIAGGARALISFGVAGGLATAALPGDIVLAQAVVMPDGSRHACAALWRDALAKRLAGLQATLHAGLIAGSAEAACTPQAKHALRQATGALAVDMESHAVAKAAAEAALPCLALRAVADPVSASVPAFALTGVDALGRTHIGPVLRGLARQPWTLPHLIRLGRHFETALASLRQVAALASPDFACHTVTAS